MNQQRTETRELQEAIEPVDPEAIVQTLRAEFERLWACWKAHEAAVETS